MRTSIVISTRGTKDMSLLISALKRQGDEVIVEIDMGANIPKTRNKGWKRASGEIVIFVDDDVIVSPDFVRKGLGQLEGADFGQSKVIGGIQNEKNKFTGTTMWFKREALKKVQGFNEKYPFFNEDIAMFVRCKRAGLKYRYLGKSVVWHPSKGQFEQLVRDNEMFKKEYPDVYKEIKREIR